MRKVAIEVSESDYKKLKAYADEEHDGDVKSAAKDCYDYGFFELIIEPTEFDDEEVK